MWYEGRNLFRNYPSEIAAANIVVGLKGSFCHPRRKFGKVSLIDLPADLYLPGFLLHDF
jgi:hypothetical protein